jgi:large conductance mechanosensitive channel
MIEGGSGMVRLLQLVEFRKFLLRGNVVELAVGVMIGAAFKTVIDSLVADVLTPLIGAIAGEPDFAGLAVTLRGSSITYGAFLNTVISFVITAIAIFYFIVTPMNRLVTRFRQDPLTSEPTTRRCPHCWTDIPTQASRCPACTSDVEPQLRPLPA